ncbi:unnamed protein product [Camellia sinensis]
MNVGIPEEEVGVAMKPVADEGKRVIGTEKVERVVRLVMEGGEGRVMRRRVRELQDSAWKALSFGALQESVLLAFTFCDQYKSW